MILFASFYFKRDIFKWFKFIMKNYLKNKSLMIWKNKINKIFKDFNYFQQALWRMYENINAKKITEWQLYDLQQMRLTFKYFITFQSITVNTKWNDMIFTAQFYKELKNVIKNEIACTNRSEMFLEINLMLIS